MIKSQTWIEFGVGDILIVPFHDDKDEVFGLILQNKKDRHIGDYDGPYLPKEDDTTISFSSLESLEVFIKQLELIKKEMQKTNESGEK
ncbi:MAG: hypothetical protein HFH60_11110 [Lachnospiraceae bacterium]|nr:hypothetical protein [Lachnospiraceae bacterium]